MGHLGLYNHAFIWDAAQGVRNLSEVLDSQYGVNVGDFRLDWPTDVSDDGRVIVGYGMHPHPGGTEAWRIVVPEASTMALLTTGVLGLLLSVCGKRKGVDLSSILCSDWKGSVRMLHGLLKCFTAQRPSRRGRHLTYQRSTGLGFEPLEDRCLLSVFLKEPYVQNVGTSSMTIMWETDAAASTLVEYRQPGETEWQSAEGESGVTIHEQELSGLSADTMYEYRVTSDSLVSLPRTFHTAPATPRSFRFVAYGDTRTNPDEHTQVVQSIVQTQPELVLHVGDLVHNGMDAREWDPQFFVPTRNLMGDTPLYPAWGNHEYYSTQANDNPLVDEYFSLPETDPSSGERWYAFTYGNVRFISLDTTYSVDFDTSGESPERDWLLDEVQSTAYTNADWQIVFFHNPPYCSRGDKDLSGAHFPGERGGHGLQRAPPSV
ncbi:MAG: hypothetical protein A2V70_01955 [Planctomycetes bacterium RBG_13_63_9]|nr:MAG: hypothetical protein A2V70_01955 [Planctomycetes bacterium RBG_13_63_9]